MKAAMRKKKKEGEDYTPPFVDRLKVSLRLFTLYPKH
jgi:hypothetical protein